jgi:moderate conductance mechanosensitive channel
LTDFFSGYVPESALVRLALIAVIALAAHLLVSGIKRVSERILAPATAANRAAAAGRRHPKIATVVSLLASTTTFAIWFIAVGFALSQFNVNLAAYFATATVIGLAVGFGSQGLVQDVVIGLTMIFTDALDIGDTVEVSGQIGRVERMGLRFTTLNNFLGQSVFIPNRNITVVGRYRRGVVRAYVDVQVPDGTDPAGLADQLQALAAGFRAQHAAAVVTDAEISSLRTAGPGGWRYIRIKFRIWPGQQALVETVFRQRVVAFMRSIDEKYADWMAPVSYRVAEPR